MRITCFLSLIILFFSSPPASCSREINFLRVGNQNRCAFSQSYCFKFYCLKILLILYDNSSPFRPLNLTDNNIDTSDTCESVACHCVTVGSVKPVQGAGILIFPPWLCCAQQMQL